MLLPESAQLSASTGVGKKVKRTTKKPKQSAIAAHVGVGTGSSNSKISVGGGAAQRDVALAVLPSQRKFEYLKASLEQLHKSLFQPLLAFDPRSSATYEDQDVPPRHVHDTDSLRSEGGGTCCAHASMHGGMTAWSQPNGPYEGVASLLHARAVSSNVCGSSHDSFSPCGRSKQLDRYMR